MSSQKYAQVIDLGISTNPIVLMQFLNTAIQRENLAPEIRRDLLTQALADGTTEGIVRIIQTYFYTSEEELELDQAKAGAAPQRPYLMNLGGE